MQKSTSPVLPRKYSEPIKMRFRIQDSKLHEKWEPQMIDAKRRLEVSKPRNSGQSQTRWNIEESNRQNAYLVS